MRAFVSIVVIVALTGCDPMGPLPGGILYRATLLPLANEQGEIVQVLGGASCKAGAEDS